MNKTPPKDRPLQSQPKPFPIELSSVIDSIIQLLLVLIGFQLILASIAYDGDDVAWIIIAEFLISCVGFGVFVSNMISNKLMYSTFGKCIMKCPSCGCNVLKILAALILFPFMIIYIVIVICKHYCKRRNSKTTDLETAAKNTKDIKAYWALADSSYIIIDLGIKIKAASLIVCFLQDLPLFIISCIIVNYLGLIIYPIVILYKLVNVFLYVYDTKAYFPLGKCVFPKYEHYYASFGLKSVSVYNPFKDDSPEFQCFDVFFYSNEEREKSVWSVFDGVKVFDNITSKWQVYTIVSIEQNNIIKVKGEDKELQFDRWSENIKPLNDEEWKCYIENQSAVDDNSKENINLTASSNSNSNSTENAVVVQMTMAQTTQTQVTEPTEVNDKNVVVDETNKLVQNKNDERNSNQQVDETNIKQDEEYQVVSMNDEDEEDNINANEK